MKSMDIHEFMVSLHSRLKEEYKVEVFMEYDEEGRIRSLSYTKQNSSEDNLSSIRLRFNADTIFPAIAEKAHFSRSLEKALDELKMHTFYSFNFPNTAVPVDVKFYPKREEE